MSVNFVTIHGIDGVGKTSVATGLARTLDGQSQPAIYYDDLAEKVKCTRIGSEIFDKKLVQSAIIARALTEGQTVTRDRWLIDVFASYV
jgi:broad-specificity NMP kinase